MVLKRFSTEERKESTIQPAWVHTRYSLLDGHHSFDSKRSVGVAMTS